MNVLASNQENHAAVIGPGVTAESAPRGMPSSQGVDLRDENPVLAFTRCFITFHLLIPGESEIPVEALSDKAVDSYERDMLAYAYRNERPFKTRMLSEPARITAVFPPVLRFFSEDSEVLLRTADHLERRVDFDVLGCITDFYGQSSQKRVLHITLSPTEGTEVNEFDLLKLAKLWEGGERVTQTVVFECEGQSITDKWPEENVDDPNDPKLECYSNQTRSSLVRWVCGLPPSSKVIPEVGFCVGTLDILDSSSSVQSLLASVRKLEANPESYASVANSLDDTGEDEADSAVELRDAVGDWQRMVAVGGLIQGLLDFAAIGEDELSDVYAVAFGRESGRAQSVPALSRSIVAVHKGTLVSLSPSTNRSLNWKTWVNPYLAIPHAVALYNEWRALQARESAVAASARRPPDLSSSDASGSFLDAFWSWGNRRKPRGRMLRMADARELLIESDSELEDFVPNVFVYPAERRVYETCHATRAISDLRSEAKERLDLSRTSVDSREKKHGAVFAIIALTLGVIATVEGYFIKTRELQTEPLIAIVVVGILPLIVYSAFFAWSRHH